MIEKKWNNDWKFWLDKDSFALVWDIPENAEKITIPHDAMIAKQVNPDSLNRGNTGFRDGDIYTYVKMLYVSDEYKEKVIKLKFEGVYMNAFVYVNGQLAAKSPFGYTTFYANLGDFLKYGEENEIRVQARSGAMTNSRWYSGAGIYRDVYLLESGLTYIESVKIKTENADKEYAVLNVNAELVNKASHSKDAVLQTVIYDQEGNEIAHESTVITLFGQDSISIKQRIAIESPKLWSADNPYLYRYETRLYDNSNAKKILDETFGNFGVRTVEVDAKRGLRINGHAVKLRGGCIHHDSGLLGSATYEDAEYRRVLKMKEAGFNAMRMSHHPMAPALLRACDEIGMYVMDETFDMWNRLKSNYDYGLYFSEWWEKDVTAMVDKDYNHPSVILYSVGNEIPEIGTNKGAETCRNICDKIRSLDDTRFTLASINGIFAAGDAVGKIIADVSENLVNNGKAEGNVNDFMSLMDKHMDEIVIHEEISRRIEKACASTDIAGYNYMTARYENDVKTYPNRVIVGSETYPPEIARNWELVESLPQVIGDFTWTGWDYIGEAGVGIPAYKWGEGGFGAAYPAQFAFCGDFDITGFRRPASYYREVVFGLTDKPYIAVQNPRHYGEKLIKTPWVISDASACWNYEEMEGKPVIVEVYSNGDEVELLLNNRIIDRKAAGKKVGFRTLFETIYEEGNLTAISYKEGQEVGRCELVTADKDRKLSIEKESYTGLRNKEQELIYLTIESKDKNGILATDDCSKIILSFDGNVDVLGFGSGNPKPNYNFNEGITELFGGRAQIIVKKPMGRATLTVNTENGISATVEL